ncbi:SPOR domain-containing protein [Parvibaculum sp.]|uniref:SPOR domain-containing protein n=1 Tax=Parvibaculum sp. TaxID=2024848 RepID=UPI00273112C2|nr:SPOR domain-containing protein [Parvibaculum sp.]MDP1628136.1 SPOR domain-containing protein [Parvibaculum sp.]MDP2151135.1 SPOR domain-containing protein [Parvibaculum sp.]MDP3330210.1 SPOR domain-containing protein [Parvibaculum sp.]
MSHRDGDWDDEPEYDIDPDIEEYEGYEDDSGDGGNRRSLMLLSVIALLVVFAGVVFLAYRQGNDQGMNGMPPILRADGEPTKEVPENPGGKKFPHQDAGVYNRIAGDGKTAPGDSEQLLPPAEEPLAIENQDVPPADRQALDRMAQAIESSPLAPTGEDEPGARVEDAAPVEEEPPVQEPAPAVQQPAAATAGGYVVQLAAFRDEASARDAFGKLQAKYPDLLGSLGVDIQRADLGDKGIYYRLRAGYLDKSAADALCGQLEAKGQGCLVRPR